MNREQWLANAAKKLDETFIFGDLETHVSVGWPSARGLSKKNKVIGQCWKPECSRDGKSQIFISPLLDNGPYVLAVLLHELIHAWDRGEHGHKGPFIELAKKVGLQKPWTSTTPGPDLHQRLTLMAEELGPYPHVPLEPLEVEKKRQSTRMLKLVSAGDCACVARTTMKYIVEGQFTCPHGELMDVELVPE